ncbi:leucine-rich repeat-containing protein 34-like [Genypterus blacodes]|uniref:leucine-rich repeat-containing protein 34-like n=1 Tax=Genypterus blacodes TaxID=154954 RepID=UPI003F77009E
MVTQSPSQLAMAPKTFSEVYIAVCAQHEMSPNPAVLEALRRSAEPNFTLKLTGNNRLRRIQRLNDRDVLALAQSLRSRDQLTGLHLGYNLITDKGVRHLAALMKESALSSLNLMYNQIQADGAQVLAESLQCNSSLLALSLSGNKLGNTGAMHIASALQVNNTLQEVQLADCDLGTQSVIAFTIALKSNTCLHCVDISRPLLFSHQEEWAEHCGLMLQVNCSLVELHLGKMGLSDSGLQRLTAGLQLNHSLRYLDLSCNLLSCDAAQLVAELLQQNATLHILDLSSNHIQDEGAENLSQALTRPGCSLTELSVCRNSIGTDGLLSLAQAVKVNSTLTHMYIWGNQLEEEPVGLVFRELISSGRLPPEQTDVSAYEVDGQVLLAEVFQRLRRVTTRDNGPASNLTADTPTKP